MAHAFFHQEQFDAGSAATRKSTGHWEHGQQCDGKPDMVQRVIDGLDELRRLVGQEIGVSDWFEVTQSLIDAFAELTGDRQWIHVDPERARAESPYGTTVAHGFLTLSLLSQLHGQVVQIHGDYRRAINFGFNRVRFPAAVPAGARVRVRSALEALEEIPAGAQLTWAVSVEIEGQSKPAVAAQWLVRLYR
jgi:acyl dehydratase